jgi:hypothetical protein
LFRGAAPADLGLPVCPPGRVLTKKELTLKKCFDNLCEKFNLILINFMLTLYTNQEIWAGKLAMAGISI